VGGCKQRGKAAYECGCGWVCKPREARQCVWKGADASQKRHMVTWVVVAFFHGVSFGPCTARGRSRCAWTACFALHAQQGGRARVMQAFASQSACGPQGPTQSQPAKRSGWEGGAHTCAMHAPQLWVEHMWCTAGERTSRAPCTQPAKRCCCRRLARPRYVPGDTKHVIQAHLHGTHPV